MGTSKNKKERKVGKVLKVGKGRKVLKKKAVAKKKTTTKKATVKKKVVAKSRRAGSGSAEKKATTKRKATSKKKKDLTLHLHHDAPKLDPVVPKLPSLPEPPEPVQHGICRHCHMLPAAAFELVIVMTCLVFSLSAVLLTSTQTIEMQQDVIATLQQVEVDVYARK